MSVMLTFIGTVVACETRFATSVTRAFVVDEPHANWILTIDIESADASAPADGGTRASFLIHSPTHTLRVAAERAPGRRFRFEIERETIDRGIRWSRFSGRQIA
ncbi:MAG TPA: hypothetical protein VH165_27985 [Kofleriaceae bacterium]|jgi:hypothetical protein|nr:hypothetical protein [Kofleriaceae bacterium]